MDVTLYNGIRQVIAMTGSLLAAVRARRSVARDKTRPYNGANSTVTTAKSESEEP